MWAHRVLLIAFWILLLAKVSAFPGGLNDVVLTLVVMTTYLALTAAACRLSDEAGIEFKPIPIVIIYFFTGIGPFVSIWLDRKASSILKDRGGIPGLLHFVRV